MQSQDEKNGNYTNADILNTIQIIQYLCLCIFFRFTCFSNFNSKLLCSMMTFISILLSILYYSRVNYASSKKMLIIKGFEIMFLLVIFFSIRYFENHCSSCIDFPYELK